MVHGLSDGHGLLEGSFIDHNPFFPPAQCGVYDLGMSCNLHLDMRLYITL